MNLSSHALAQAGAAGTDTAVRGVQLQRIGTVILRYGLVLMLLMGGAQKWTRAEAEGIQPWIAHSPLLSWLYGITTVQNASIAIGVVEIALALMIAARPWFPRLTLIGSLCSVLMFLTTLSFLFTTPNQGADAQGFLVKDVFLLGTALWSAGEALTALRARRMDQ